METLTENQLTVKELKILSALDLNARASNSQIAKATKLSNNIVNYQIKRLEKNGFIKNYLVVMNYFKLGYFLCKVCINLYEHEAGKKEDIIQYLIKEKRISTIDETSGDWDLVFTLFLKELKEFSENWEKITANFRTSIKEYQTSIFTKESYFPHSYIKINRETLDCSWEIDCKSPKEAVDGTDLQILSLLAKNSRTEIKTIAEEIGLGSMAIIYRLKQMAKKKIILGYRAEINFSKLGYEQYIVSLELESREKIKELKNYLKLLPVVIYLSESISDNVDLEVGLEVKNFEEFSATLEQLKQKFPRMLRDYKYIKLLERRKQNYLVG